MEEHQVQSPQDKKSNTGWKVLGAVVGTAAIVGAIWLLKNNGTVRSIPTESSLILTEKATQVSRCKSTVDCLTATENVSVQKSIVCNDVINIHEHIRNLTGGKKPSAAKIATAHEHNFELGEYQTWVENYTRKRNCA